MNDKIKRLRDEYLEGDIVVLVNMEGENLACGLKGTVVKVDDIGQIHVNWENGSRLALNSEFDTFYKK